MGYNDVDAMLASHVPAGHSFVLALLKPVATSLTLGAGGSGGVFAPSLFAGAMLGNAFGGLVHGTFPAWTAGAAAYGLVGMAAVFAAAAEAPITAIMIVFEMSNDYTIILPLMICTVIATLIGRRLLGHTIYERKLVRRGNDWARVRKPRPFTRVLVSSVQREPPLVASVMQPIRGIAQNLERSAEFVVPVVEKGRFVGMVTASDVAAAMIAQPAARAGDIAQPVGVTLGSGDTLEEAAVAMAEPHTALLPVVDKTSGNLVGIVTRRDVLNAYRGRSDI